jgi:protein disulfide-isomerase
MKNTPSLIGSTPALPRKVLFMRILAFLVALMLPSATMMGSMPYDESADAKTTLKFTLASAQAAQVPVLVIFGANWCEDCRALDRTMSKARNLQLISRSFKVVKVDVGNFDKNLEIAEAYGNPTKKGIPAAILLSPDGQIVYATRAGELADARRMSESGVYEFLAGVARRGNMK